MLVDFFSVMYTSTIARKKYDYGFPPAIPATKAKYHVKLAPSSNHELWNPQVKNFQAVAGSEIARFAISIPLHPESTELMIHDNFVDHSNAT